MWLSATLLAALFTIVATPLVSAAVSVTSVGNVPRGGSATGLVYTFTESAAGCIPNSAGSLTVTIADSAAGATVSYTGTPVVSTPGSMGTITSSASGQVLTVSWTASDTLNIESITVSGLGISATTVAALGAISATLASASLACFQAGGTASGTLAAGVGIGASAVTVNVTTPGCTFVATAGAPGGYAFAQNPEEREGTAGALTAGQQVLTLTTPTTAVHDAATVVTQASACAASGVLASPGTVVDSLIFNSPSQLTVIPGENNQDAGDLTVTERTAGFLSVGTTLTFTIATAGVTFSHAPTATSEDGLVLTGGTAALSPDLKSVTVTVATASTSVEAAPDPTITISNIDYDVAANVPAGTQVSVGLVVSGSKVVTPTSRSNAVVGRVIVGIGATPTVYIGENNQASGLITLTESGAGFFTDGSGLNNVFGLCLVTDEQFTLAPWAIVTGPATGALRLREGAVASPDNIVLGTLTTNASGSSCAYWTVWTAGTAASTIEIRATDPAAPTAPLASGPTAGPRLSVGGTGDDLNPGTTQAGIYFGTLASITGGADSAANSLVVFAVRAFRSGVVVAALSQPTIPRGSSGAAAGNLTITETLAGQLKAGQDICVEILPRTNQPSIQDTLLLTAVQNQLPIVSTNLASGLAVGPVTVSGIDTFCFSVTQQAIGTLGVITISNISYITVADAINGAVLVRVSGDTDNGATPFEAVVSNAKIGSAVAGTAASRLGVTQTGSFTTATKVQVRGRYVTFRFDFGVAAAGQRVEIWAATKTGNDWSGFAKVTARIANASGVVYYYIRQNATTWKSYRAFWAGGGVYTPARQARWR
jgi:hypothetical protein